jgi:Arc/MetJ family transcription regulator
MKINLEIDNSLISEIKSLTKLKTKKEIIHTALQHFLSYSQRKEMVNLFGKVEWEGDLNKMRTAKN